jgi:hypothetical protein
VARRCALGFAGVLYGAAGCGGLSTHVTPRDDGKGGADSAGFTASGGRAGAGLGGSAGTSMLTAGRSASTGGHPSAGRAAAGAVGQSGGQSGKPGAGQPSAAGEGDRSGAGGADAETDVEGDIERTELSVDLDTHGAIALITLAASASAHASFEIGDLEILSVTDGASALPYDTDTPARLRVELPVSTGSSSIRVSYRFHDHLALQGHSSQGYTFTWPYYCGNLFPCHSDPEDGMRFVLDVHGGAAPLVYPPSIPAEAPSYMLAWIEGDYTELALGTTVSGTAVTAFYRTGVDALDGVQTGVAPLRAAFEWLETTLGPYAFGPKVASVSAPWHGGGMEHHPFWHVASDSMAVPRVHVHEASHGWFGDGVRLRCWEDLVLSEGTASYLAARALEAVGAQADADAAWEGYRASAFADDGTWASSWPATCGTADVLHDGFFSARMYARGALFYGALEKKIGRAALDATLSAFYREWVGKAATFQDLLDTVKALNGYDAKPCAVQWLRTEQTPADVCE